MTKKAKWHKTVDEALKSVKIGTSEEAFLTAELKHIHKSVENYKVNIEILKKSIIDSEFLVKLYDKRIKEIENET